ncbi:hypothetical protein [Mesobacillus harenae]|uniref:hypothetical protein n=1 Tax=Mesobacillus harenae TaxID=2213203 RepID=UPI00157FFB6C|nr:hypothetical protein [Mesobacillus harenae]
MFTLKEETFELIKKYMQILHTVEEAFEFISEGYEAHDLTGSEELVKDTFKAFSQIMETHFLLGYYFRDKPAVLNVLAEFEEVAKLSERLHSMVATEWAKQQFIHEQLYPAFIEWSTAVQKELNPYIQS